MKSNLYNRVSAHKDMCTLFRALEEAHGMSAAEDIFDHFIAAARKVSSAHVALALVARAWWAAMPKMGMSVRFSPDDHKHMYFTAMRAVNDALGAALDEAAWGISFPTGPFGHIRWGMLHHHHLQFA